MTLSGEAEKAVLDTNIDAVTVKTGVKEWSHKRKMGSLCQTMLLDIVSHVLKTQN